LDARDMDGLWRQRDARVVLAEWQTFPVGFLIARVRGGAGRWTVGVREGHRRRGLGRALAAAAAAFFRSRAVPAVATCWGTDTVAAAFIRRLGARVERTYLYLDRAL
jgi:ribosomal protein S18 acetylase RimI-like enzyme